MTVFVSCNNNDKTLNIYVAVFVMIKTLIIDVAVFASCNKNY